MSETGTQPRKVHWLLKGLVGALLVPLIVVMLPVAMVLTVIYYLWHCLVYLAIWMGRCIASPWVLFVYSDSPNWKEYIESNVLPELPANSHVLNWSQRSSWRLSFPVSIFRHFAGRTEFCPLALVFRFGRPAKQFRFYQPFRDHKHGNVAPLEHMQTALFSELKGHAL